MNIEIDVDEEFAKEKRLTTALIQYQQSNNERRWRLSYLKDQFESLKLHKLFNRYIQRISHGYFSQFLSLQIILVTTHFVILLATTNPHDVFPDLILYGLISSFTICLLVITDTYVKEHPKILKILTGSAFVVAFFMNAFIPFYYRRKEPYGNLRPAYTTYLIISNYIFLNIQNDLVALVIGLFVSIFHLVTLILVTYENTDRLFQRIGSDLIFLISINCLGMYFRYMNEIVIRRSFLDRRACVESTHQLKFEEEQENYLMSSIIPQHIIAKVRKTLMEYIRHNDKNNDIVATQKPFEDLYVEEHPNVTILFADIVNYTMMTTQLDVTNLLDILNELFGRFDDASEKLKVLRIKFLGDCYYCVAGLPPDPAPNHAEACVDLGLKMISIIADIRERHNLDINMRIGIHTGKISCGIIGNIKWQYDIWSTDVDIANKMETDGTAGMVHITTETKDLLRKKYNIFPSTKIVNHSPTFLIQLSEKNENTQNEIENIVKETDQNIYDNNQKKTSMYIKRSITTPNEFKNTAVNSQSTRSLSLNSNYQAVPENGIIIENDKRTLKRYTVPWANERRISMNTGMSIQRRLSGNIRFSGERRLTPNDRKRRTAFMNNNIKRYNERLEETNEELKSTIENMLLSKFEQWFKVSEMYRLFLVFKDLKSEKEFIKMPDPLFKYYLLSEILLLLLVYILENLTLSSWDTPSWSFYVTLGVIIFIFLPLSWTHYIWTKYIAKTENHVPNNQIVYFLWKTSKMITTNVIVRFIIYTAVYMLFCLSVLTEWLDCYEADLSGRSLNSSSTTKKNFLFLMTQNTRNISDVSHCIIPWHMTETFALAIIMSFLFLRMYMWLKLLYATAISGVYAFCILQFSGEFYGDSQTFNYALSPQISHIMGIFFLTLVLHLVDRQTEYMNRIDHLWYKNLIEKEEQASDVQRVNNLLLTNILPMHVAELYLNVNRHSSEEVYNETYDEAAVMFASITNFSVEDMGPGFLKTMSTIISEFDMLLLNKTYGRHIEKIKIAKWTYMAASGLAPGLGNGETIRRSQTNHVVISLLKFAVNLMQKLKEINCEMLQEMKLRIGISHGGIVAGVVGSKKPLYDIWGDPVNMASRMDTTGLVDHIQVLKPTAEIIERYGYICISRGKIRVKGRNNDVETYFVALDDNFELIKQPVNKTSEDGSRQDPLASNFSENNCEE